MLRTKDGPPRGAGTRLDTPASLIAFILQVCARFAPCRAPKSSRPIVPVCRDGPSISEGILTVFFEHRYDLAPLDTICEIGIFFPFHRKISSHFR